MRQDLDTRRIMRRQYAYMLLIFALAFVILTLARQGVRPVTTPPDGVLRVMSFNIRHGEGMDGQVSLQRIADVVRTAQADVVGLNEVDRRLPRSGFTDQAARLAKMLDMQRAFEPNMRWYLLAEYGNAILSKYPIKKIENHLLPRIGNNERRGVLVAELDVAGQRVNVMATHLALTDEERIQQTKRIAGIAQALEGPVILLGDFNAEPNSPEMETLTTKFQDVLAGAGPEGMTFPSNDPDTRIDYVLVRSVAGVKSARVLDSLASDHRPVLAEVKIR
jgi:endonuclease/exonuclease/phosphatase family metal-dependent hydrolase